MYIVVLITVPSPKEARRIGENLIKDKLAACVNIIKGVDSLFWWQGKIDRAKELLLVVKTTKDRLNVLIKRVRSLHSYEVPEIIALPILGGNKDYLKWIDESVWRRS